MKEYFPFTDYDFYAYLTSGGLLLAVLDFAWNDAALLTRDDWTIIQIIATVIAAYLTGQLVAMLAQSFLEMFVMRKLFAKPMEIQLGLRSPRWRESVLGFLVGRYYGPLPTTFRGGLLNKAAQCLGCTVDEVTDCEDVFQLGFQKSFEKESVRIRIDDFRNQYGLCRNIAFVALVGLAIFAWRIHTTGAGLYITPFWISLLAFMGMFVRYVKFLASFQAEVIKQLS